MKLNLKRWLIFGTIFIIITGTFAHFLYELSGYNPIVGLFTAINESTWEHIKMGLFGSLLLFIIQYPYFRKDNRYFVGTFFSSLSIILFIPLFFYGYQLLIEESLIMDILDFIFAIIVGQYIFYRVMMLGPIRKLYKMYSLIGMVIIIISYLSLSYFPPHVFLFKDPATKSYGINPDIRYIHLNEEVVLKKGESALITDENIKITITGFINSPCPKGVECIWEGLAVLYDVYVDDKKLDVNESKYMIEIIKSDYKTYAKLMVTNKLD